MKCYAHPDVEAKAFCTDCGHAVCSDCRVKVGVRLLCQECARSRLGAPAQPPRSEANALAIVSLLLGIVGLLACACAGSIGGLPVGAAAIIAGVIARGQIAEGRGDGGNRLVANLGIAIGIAEVALSLLVLFAAGLLAILGFIAQATGQG